MRNLEILSKFTGGFEHVNGGGEDTVATACIDEFGHFLFVYTIGHSLYVYKFNPERPSDNLQFVAQEKFNHFFEGEDNGVFIVSVEYVQEISAAVLAFSNGEIYLYENESKKVKEAGVIDGDILACKWSPNEEHFAVASDNGQLYLFTPDFDILYEVDIDDGDLTFTEADKEYIEKGTTPNKEYISQACISWRGDSSVFQINYRINGGFKCLTRDVELGLKVQKGPARADDNTVFSVSEKPIHYLEKPICFMANGSHIAGYQ